MNATYITIFFWLAGAFVWIVPVIAYVYRSRGLASGKMMIVGHRKTNWLSLIFSVVIVLCFLPSVYSRWNIDRMYSLSAIFLLSGYLVLVWSNLAKKYGALLENNRVSFVLGRRSAFRYKNIVAAGVKLDGKLLLFQHKTGSFEAVDIDPNEVDAIRTFLADKGIALQQ